MCYKTLLSISKMTKSHHKNGRYTKIKFDLSITVEDKICTERHIVFLQKTWN